MRLNEGEGIGGADSGAFASGGVSIFGLFCVRLNRSYCVVIDFGGLGLLA